MRTCFALLLLAAVACDSGAERERTPLEIDWIVKKGQPDARGRRMHLLIPREYVLEYLSARQTPQEEAALDSNGIQNVTVAARLADLTPILPGPAGQSVGPVLWLRIHSGGGGTTETMQEFTRFGHKKGRHYRRPDIHGLEWYVPMGCGALIRDIKTPKPPDDLSPDGCREIQGDHQLLPQGRPVWMRCQSLTGGLCVYSGCPDWWRLEIRIPATDIAEWQKYERAALELLAKFRAN